MVRYFPRFGRAEFNWRLTPFHLLSAKRTTRKKLAQLKNTSKEQQRNPVIFFFFPGVEAFGRSHAFKIWAMLR